MPAGGTAEGEVTGSDGEGKETETAGMGGGGPGITGITAADGFGRRTAGGATTVERVLAAVFRARGAKAWEGFSLAGRLGALLGVGVGDPVDEGEAGGIGVGRGTPCSVGNFLREAGLAVAGVAVGVAVGVDTVLGGGVGGAGGAGGAVVARGDRRETGEGDDWAAGRFGDFMRQSVPPEGDPGPAEGGRAAVGVQRFWGD